MPERAPRRRAGATVRQSATQAVSGQVGASTGLSGGKASQLERLLLASILASGLPTPEREFLAVPGRRFRLDFAWPAQRLGVEVEGGIYRGGGHTSVKGIKRDLEKANLLMLGGWRLLRVHGDQVRSGEATALIRQALEAG